MTNLYAATPLRAPPTTTRRSSGSTRRPQRADRTIQILGINDFHGRMLNDPTAPTAGAAVLAGAVKQLRAENPNTVFAAAGDLIGASTFESFIQRDKPTIDALNAAGLDVSAVGNHEFDQGYDDLVNRVMALRRRRQPLRRREVGVPRRQRDGSTRRRRPRPAADVDQGPSAASRSASWARSPSTCPSSSRPAASPSIEVTDIVDGGQRGGRRR